MALHPNSQALPARLQVVELLPGPLEPLSLPHEVAATPTNRRLIASPAQRLVAFVFEFIKVLLASADSRVSMRAIRAIWPES